MYTSDCLNVINSVFVQTFKSKIQALSPKYLNQILPDSQSLCHDIWTVAKIVFDTTGPCSTAPNL